MDIETRNHKSCIQLLRIESRMQLSRCFKKHFHEIMNERWHNEESSSLFFYFLLITHCKKKISKFRENVNLNLIDCSLELLSSFLPDKINLKTSSFKFQCGRVKKSSGWIVVQLFQKNGWNKSCKSDTKCRLFISAW